MVDENDILKRSGSLVDENDMEKRWPLGWTKQI